MLSSQLRGLGYYGLTQAHRAINPDSLPPPPCNLNSGGLKLHSQEPVTIFSERVKIRWTLREETASICRKSGARVPRAPLVCSSHLHAYCLETKETKEKSEKKNKTKTGNYNHRICRHLDKKPPLASPLLNPWLLGQSRLVEMQECG